MVNPPYTALDNHIVITEILCESAAQHGSVSGIEQFRRSIVIIGSRVTPYGVSDNYLVITAIKNRHYSKSP